MAPEPFIFLAVFGLAFISLMSMRQIAIRKNRPRRSTYIEVK
jgi:hypothetical protein